MVFFAWGRDVRRLHATLMAGQEARRCVGRFVELSALRASLCGAACAKFGTGCGGNANGHRPNGFSNQPTPVSRCRIESISRLLLSYDCHCGCQCRQIVVEVFDFGKR